MATDEMVTVPEASETDTEGRRSLLGSWWAIALTALVLGLALLGTPFRLRFPFPLGFALGFASQRIHVRVLGHTSA